MALLPPRRGGKRKRVSLKGAVMADVSGGAERLRAWPRSRGPARTESHKEQTEWFGKIQKAFQYIDPKIQATFQEATAGTPFMPRDLFTQIAAGRFLAFRMPDGRIVTSMAAKLDVSLSLDVIGNTPGYTLIRGPELWGAGPNTQASPAAVRCARSTDIAAWATAAPMAWQSAPMDDPAAWDIAQPTRITIPHGISRARFDFGAVNTGGSSANVSGTIRRNGSEIVATNIMASGLGNQAINLTSGILPVTAGDYFEGWIQLSSATGKSWVASRCFFSAELYT